MTVIDFLINNISLTVISCKTQAR